MLERYPRGETSIGLHRDRFKKKLQKILSNEVYMTDGMLSVSLVVCFAGKPLSSYGESGLPSYSFKYMKCTFFIVSTRKIRSNNAANILMTLHRKSFLCLL